MDLWPSVFLCSRVFYGLLDPFPASGEVNSPILREGLRGERPEYTPQVVIDRQCDELTLAIEVRLQVRNSIKRGESILEVSQIVAE